jgi:hypothetical protein
MGNARQGLSRKTRVLLMTIIAIQIIFLGALPNLTLVHAAPDFGLTISQSCFTYQTCFLREPTQVGLTAKFIISYIPYGGFMEPINETLSCCGVPVASFGMTTFFLSSPTSDTLIIGRLSPDTTYQLTVLATAIDGNSHSVTTTITTPKASSADSLSNGVVGSTNLLIPDFNMYITPATQTPKGVTSVTYYITYNSIDSFAGPIDEKVVNLPPQFVTFTSRPYPPPYGPASAYPPFFGRCYVRIPTNSCTDALTIYFTNGSGNGSPSESLASGKTYSLIVVGAAEGGFPTHSVTVTLTVP